MGQQAVGNLAVILSANAGPMMAGFKQGEQAAAQFSQNISVKINQRIGGGMAAAGKEAGGGFASAFLDVVATRMGALTAALSVGAVVKHGISEAMKTETSKVSLSAILGDPGQADALLSQIDQLATSTGMARDGLRESAQQLINNGIAARQVMPWLKAIANVNALSGGGEERGKRIASAITQILGKGELRAEEVKSQLGDAGFPIQELAKTAGMSMKDFNKAMEEGHVGVDVLIKTLNRLNEDKNVVGKVADTTEGQLGRLRQQFDQTAESIGNLFKGGESAVTMLTDSLKGWQHALSGGLKRNDRWDVAKAFYENLWLGDFSTLASSSKFAKSWAVEAFDPQDAAAAARRAADAAAEAAQAELDRAKIEIPWAMTPNPKMAGFVASAGEIEKRFADHRISPFDEFRSEMQRATQAREKGGLDISAFRTAGVVAFDKLEKATAHLFETRLPQAMERGTQAAESAISHAMSSGGAGADVQQRIQRVLEAAWQEHIKIRTNTKDTVKALEKIDLKKVGF